MPQRKVHRVKQRTIPKGAVFQLVVGRDFFGDGYGLDFDGLREAWQDPDMREQVYQRAEERAQRAKTGEPWALRAFGPKGTETHCLCNDDGPGPCPVHS